MGWIRLERIAADPWGTEEAARWRIVGVKRNGKSFEVPHPFTDLPEALQTMRDLGDLLQVPVATAEIVPFPVKGRAA